MVCWLGLAAAAAPLKTPEPLAEPLAEPRFEAVSDAGAIPDGVVSAVTLDPQGLVWVGTSVGLLRFDGHHFVPVSMAGLGRGSAGTTFVRALMAGRDGRIWVGTEGQLLGAYDPRTDQWQVFRHDPQQPGSLGGVVRTLAEDAQGRIWVGSTGGGLQVLEPGSTQFKRYGAAQGLPDPRVQKIAIGPDGTVWVGTWNGLVRLAPDATRLTPLSLKDGSDLRLPGQVVHAIAPLRDGSLWLGTQEGELWRVGLTEGESTQLDRRPGGLGAVLTTLNVINGGRRDLGPETSEQYTLGVVFEPSRSFSASVDYWSIDRDDTISILSLRQLIDNFSLFEERFIRNAGGQLLAIDQTWANAGTTSTQGIDITVRGAFDALGGTITAGIDGTYLLEKDEQVVASAPVTDLLGVFSFSGDLGLEWKHNAFIGWANDDWSVNLTQIFRLGYQNQQLPGVANGTVNPPNDVINVDDYIIYNLSVSFTGIENMRFTMGVKNLFDTDPPFAVTYDSNTGSGSSWEPRVADPRGRAFTLAAEFKF